MRASTLVRAPVIVALVLSASASAQGVEPVEPYGRPAWAATVDVFGIYEIGAGVSLERRITEAVVLRGGAGRRGGIFGLLPGVTVGGGVLGVAGWRWVEAEAGAGVAVDAGGRSDEPVVPNGYGGLRVSVPMGRSLDGATVSRDLIVRAGVTTFLRRYASGGAEWLTFPSLSAGVAF